MTLPTLSVAHEVRARVCRHGHAGWMYQRVMFDGRWNRWYACWVCRECERLRNQECSRRRRQVRRERVAA